MMNKNTAFLMAALLALVLACNLTNIPPTGGPTPVGGAAPGGGSSPRQTPTPTPIPSVPVGIQAGLASLNSYSLAIENNSTGPTQAEYSHTRIEIQDSKDLDASSTHYTINQLTASDTEPSKTDNYDYSIGNDTCSGSDTDGWTYTKNTPQQTEMQKLLAGMMDYHPIIDDPSFVGSEMMNGIMTNHFSFQVSGLGLQSGAQVITNQGDYWLAQDGQYIVKYSLIVETQDPSSQANQHLDVLIDLTGINQPVSIAFPAGCVP
jgi:hypothetical protein